MCSYLSNSSYTPNYIFLWLDFPYICIHIQKKVIKVPPVELSTQLKVMAPFFTLSLKRIRNVPLGLPCSRSLVLRLLTNPMMCLKSKFSKKKKKKFIISLSVHANKSVGLDVLLWSLTRPAKDQPGVFWLNLELHQSKSRHFHSDTQSKVTVLCQWKTVINMILVYLYITIFNIDKKNP